MPRKKGIAYWVDDAWREAVEARMAAKNWDAIELAKKSKVGASTISELLSGKRHTCVRLPALHAALEFPPPCPPLLPERVRRILAVFDAAGSEEAEKGILMGLAASLKKLP